jgi:hypothetical protein
MWKIPAGGNQFYKSITSHLKDPRRRSKKSFFLIRDFKFRYVGMKKMLKSVDPSCYVQPTLM